MEKKNVFATYGLSAYNATERFDANQPSFDPIHSYVRARSIFFVQNIRNDRYAVKTNPALRMYKRQKKNKSTTSRRCNQKKKMKNITFELLSRIRQHKFPFFFFFFVSRSWELPVQIAHQQLMRYNNIRFVQYILRTCTPLKV